MLKKFFACLSLSLLATVCFATDISPFCPAPSTIKAHPPTAVTKNGDIYWTASSAPFDTYWQSGTLVGTVDLCKKFIDANSALKHANDVVANANFLAAPILKTLDHGTQVCIYYIEPSLRDVVLVMNRPAANPSSLISSIREATLTS